MKINKQSRPLSLFELVRVFELDAIQMWEKNSEHESVKLRIEIFKYRSDRAQKPCYKAKVFRSETYDLVPTFVKGVNKKTWNAEILVLDDVNFKREQSWHSEREVLNYILDTISTIFQVKIKR
jgi:hypothetical protein